MPAQELHPDGQQLSAFALGKLPPQDAADVERHVSECAVCTEALSRVHNDTLVGMLRCEQTVEQSTAHAGSGNEPASPTAVEGLPLELCNHERYRIERLLGKGGMGTVYLAEHRLMRRRVALKVIDRQWTTNPAAVERFRRETRAAARLTHPNIVTAHDAEQAGDLHLLVMEYIDGQDLAEVVRRRGALPVGEACEYIRQAALGLEHAAACGMVHRDIKPQNLMLDHEGHIKILDFGLASLASEADGTLTAAGAIMGTPDYIAPEQARDARGADARSDIYSLGCTLYFLLTGVSPVPHGSVVEKVMAHVENEPKPISEIRADVPVELQAILQRMMAKRPEERFQTPGEVAAAVAHFSQRPGGVVFRPPSPAVTARSLARNGAARRKPIAAACLLGLPLLAAVLYVVTDRGTLEIQTLRDDIKVEISQGGELIQVVDLATQSQVRLKSGSYDIALQGHDNDVKLDRNQFTLTRLGTAVVEIRTRNDQGKFVSPSTLATFDVSDETITQDGVSVDEGGWKIVAQQPRTVRLFEVSDPGADNCMVWYRAELKSKNVQGKAYLEMWCRLPGSGEYFSKGLHMTLSGDNGWSSSEIPFRLESGQRPDLIKLNVTIEGTGTVWIKNIELRKAPLVQ